MHIHSEISVCSDCAMFIANGELPEEDGNKLISAIESNWKDLSGQIVLGDNDTEEFSWSPCECCGSSLGGNRFSATVLCNHQDCE